MLLMQIRFVWSIITPRPTVYDVQMRIIQFLEVEEREGRLIYKQLVNDTKSKHHYNPQILLRNILDTNI